MKKIKRIVSAMLATAMIMSMSVPAFASGTVADPTDTTAFSEEILTKTYDVKNVENGSTTIVPAENLTFSVTPDDTSYPEVTVEALEVTGVTNKLKVNVPSYSAVGIYHYTVKEDIPTGTDKAQGVTYSTNEIKLSVTVTYANDAHTALTAELGIFNDAGKGEATNKVSELVNTYVLGSLDVSKTVTGKLGDKNKYFDVKVTFTANEAVKSAITISGGSNSENASVIDADWTGNKEVTIKIKDGETIHFTNIPDGVSYTVVEADYTEGTQNSENGYDAAKYTNSDDATETTTGKGSIQSTKEDSVITADDDTVAIVNNKEVVVDTGISLDNMPYIMVLALVALGLVGFVSKKRSMEF